MPIYSIMHKALKILSYSDIDLKKSYKIERFIIDMIHHHYLKPLYKIEDYKVRLKDREIPIRLFFPSDEGNYPLLIFFHGGGWVTGNIDSYNKVCTHMARQTKHIVISVDYRLAPEHPFPAAPEDCYHVVREIVKDTALFNVQTEDITLIGDSAGGNLAAVVSLMARDRGEFEIKRQILLYPATYNDHTINSQYHSVIENGTGYLLTSKRICDYMDLYIANNEDYNNPYFAPLLASSYDNQPNTLIITAEYDLLRDEGEDYGEKLQEAGNKVTLYRMPKALHGFISLPPSFSHVKKCYKIINQFLSEAHYE